MKTIALVNSDRVALVDEDDYEMVSEFRWRLAKTSIPGLFYAETSLAGEDIRMHRLLLGLVGRFLLADHVNHDGLDNQRSNLRVASVQQNGRNKRSWGQSGFKGVSFDKRRKHRPWTARLFINRKVVSLGAFETGQQAADAYDRAASALFGEFALTNKMLVGDLVKP